MITITVMGLDEYIVGRYSRIHSANLAKLFEVNEDEINFFAPNGFVIHNGTEQTSWNTIVRINLPEKFESIEDKVSKYITETLKGFSINVYIEFYYCHGHHQHEFINKEYPRYVDDGNTVSIEEDELLDGEELYEGNVFEGMEDKLEEAARERCGCNGDDCECDGECECGGNCDCDDDHADCECGHCHCESHKH